MRILASPCLFAQVPWMHAACQSTGGRQDTTFVLPGWRGGLSAGGSGAAGGELAEGTLGERGSVTLRTQKPVFVPEPREGEVQLLISPNINYVPSVYKDLGSALQFRYYESSYN